MQTDRPAAEPKARSGRSDATRRPSLSAGLLGFAILLFANTLIHAARLDVSWPTENFLFLLFLAISGGWSCRFSIALLLVSIACAIWWLVDVKQDPEFVLCSVRHLWRLVALGALVVVTATTRRSLDEARENARVDSLTGLPNRRAVIEALDAELSRLKRFQRSFSVAMIDCDGFKSINDQQGHLVGDRVLQLIGTALRQQRRAYDSVGRWGGDEFVLILPETTEEEIPIVIERLRAHLSHKLLQQYPLLAFSIGVVTIQSPQDLAATIPDATTCLNAADQLMYAAKRSGKDQTRFSLLEDLQPAE